jgi:hypothetical protein
VSLSPTTELEAINQMLMGIGESPISNLSNAGLADAATARQTLRNVSREVQSKGWYWNTDKGLVLSLSIPSNNINVPANTLKVDTVYPDDRVNVVLRGNRLYNNDKHTYEFEKSLKVDLVSFLDFTDLPEPARNYITLRAVRRFQEGSIGSVELSQFHKRDELQAWTDLVSDEADSADFNILNNWSVGRVLNR